jgi:hypothetical protein
LQSGTEGFGGDALACILGLVSSLLLLLLLLW